MISTFNKYNLKTKDMNKEVIKNTVERVINRVRLEFNTPIEEFKISMEFDRSLDFEFQIGEFKRGVTVRDDTLSPGCTVSHGIHSPSDSKADLIQQIICGRIADIFLKEKITKHQKTKDMKTFIIEDSFGNHIYIDKTFQSFDDGWSFLYEQFPVIYREDGTQDDRDEELGEVYVIELPNEEEE